MMEESKEGPLFTVSEKVLCFHGPLIYEGKVLKLQIEVGKETLYLIHYAGWSKKWDEYVPESRVLKLTDENLKRQKEYEAAMAASAKKSGTKSSVGGKAAGSGGGSKKNTPVGVEGVSPSLSLTPDSRPVTPLIIEEEQPSKIPSKSKIVVVTTAIETTTPLTASPIVALDIKKRKQEVHVEVESHSVKKIEVRVNFPEKLRTVLIDDFDLILRQKKLLTLPARSSVDSMLDDYHEFLENSPPVAQGKLDYIKGVREYFNTMLGTQGLYRYERVQYSNLLRIERGYSKDDVNLTPMSSIYGPVHLLRVMTKFGNNIPFTTLEQVSALLFQNFTEEFLDFIVSRHEEYFHTDDYALAPPEYQRKSPV